MIIIGLRKLNGVCFPSVVEQEVNQEPQVQTTWGSWGACMPCRKFVVLEACKWDKIPIFSRQQFYKSKHWKQWILILLVTSVACMSMFVIIDGRIIETVDLA